MTKSENIAIDFINMRLRNIPSKLKKDYDIANGVIVQENNNAFLYSKLGIRRGYIITGINDVKIYSVNDISKLSQKYGNDILDNIYKLEYLDTNLERKEVVFK